MNMTIMDLNVDIDTNVHNTCPSNMISMCNKQTFKQYLKLT